MPTLLTGALAGGSIITNIIIGLLISKLFAPDEPPQPKDQGVQVRLSADPSNKFPVVYGERRVGGMMTMADISSNNQKMAFIISLSEGPVEAINEVHWQDKKLSFANPLSSTLQNVTNATDADNESHDFLNGGRMKVAVFLGGSNNSCPPMEAFSSKWATNKSERLMPGIAYAYVELTYDREKRVTGLPSALHFNVKGRKIKTLSSGGTLSTSETYSTNPAECTVDYLTNTIYGCSIPLGSLDLESFYNHKTFCDLTKSYVPSGGGTASAKQYTTNGVLNTNTEADKLISQLTISNSVDFNWNLGQFALVTGKVKSSTHSFSENNIYGGIDISVGGFNTKLNRITSKYSEKQDEEAESQVILNVPASNKNVNEPLLEQTWDFPFTNNNIEAERAAAIILNQSRQDLVAVFITDLSAYGTQAGDVIDITHKTPDWNGKKFRVLSVEEIVRRDQSISLEFTVQEYADEVYDDRSINEFDPAPNTNFPNRYRAPSVNSVTAIEDTSIIEANLIVSWVDIESVYTNQYIVGHKISSNNDNTYSFKTVTGGQRCTISPLESSTTYEVSVQPVSSAGVLGTTKYKTVSTAVSRSVAGPAGLSSRLDIAYSTSSNGATGSAYPTGILTGNVDAIKIVLADFADSTSDEISIQNLIGTIDNSFLKNTGTATGTEVAFSGSASDSSTTTKVTLGFNQPFNEDSTSDQIDAIMADYNAIPLLGASSTFNLGNYKLQRSSEMVKIDSSSFYIFRRNNEVVATDPTFTVSNWNLGTPTITNETVPRNTYRSAVPPTASKYFGERVVNWQGGVSEPDPSTDYTLYAWTENKGDKGFTGNINLYMYRKSVGKPDTPTGASYDEPTDVLTPSTNWHVSVATATGSGKLWQVNGSYSFETGSLTAWQEPFDVGQGAPTLTAIDIIDEGTTEAGTSYKFQSTLTDDNGNTNTLDSSSWVIPDTFNGLSDVETTNKGVGTVLVGTATQVKYENNEDFLDSGVLVSAGLTKVKSSVTGSITLSPSFDTAGAVTGTATNIARSDHTHDGIDNLQNIPTVPTSNGDYVLRQTDGTETWQSASGSGTVTVVSGGDGVTITNGTTTPKVDLGFTTSGSGTNGTAVTVARGDHTHSNFEKKTTSIGQPTTAVKSAEYFVDTSSARSIATPASPSAKDKFWIRDDAHNAGTNNITITQTASVKIAGLDESFVLDEDGAAVMFTYINTTRGWEVYRA